MESKSFFRTLLAKCPVLNEVLVRARQLGLRDYYVGAGIVTQTVWNLKFGYPALYGVKDLDFAYFAPDTMDAASEEELEGRLSELCADLGVKVDAKNQARVHLWYEARFGYPIAPYMSLEAALATWPTTATAVGLRLEQDGRLTVFAPFGINDLTAGVVRANKVQITREIYESKASRWKERWPGLVVIPWDEDGGAFQNN